MVYTPLPWGRNGIGVPLATSVRNSSTDCDDCRFIGTKEYSLESLVYLPKGVYIVGGGSYTTFPSNKLTIRPA